MVRILRMYRIPVVGIQKRKVMYESKQDKASKQEAYEAAS